MTDQIIAYGAIVERSQNGVTWARIPECKGVAIPAVTTEYQDATSLDSPNGFREFVKGMKDAGEITVPAGYTTAGYQQQLSDQNFNGLIYYRTTLRPSPTQSTGDVFEFRGFPTPEIETGDLAAPINMNIRIKVSGAPVWTAGLGL
jgi:hypothetical protein